MSEQPKTQQFDVKVEVLVPATITYRVSAIDEHDALKQIEMNKGTIRHNQQNIARKIKLKATVYPAFSSLIKLSKTYRSM